MDWTYLAVFLSGIGIGLLVARMLLRPSFPGAGSEVSDNQTTSQTEESREAVLLDQLQQTELAYQMAAEMSQFQAGFLARTSHELRSPINSVISLHQLILADLCESPEEEREYLDQASMAAQRMLAALDELITVSKVQHGRIELQIQPVNLKLVLDDVQRLTQLQAKNKNLRLEIESPSADVYVLTDPSRLRQVIVHLMDWAIAHLDEGKIWVKTESLPEKHQVYIVIADDQPERVWAETIDLLKTTALSTESISKDTVTVTLPPIEEARAFEAQTTHTPLPQGLTLFAARTLIEKMQGTLDLIPTPTGDRGYAVRCSIPLVEPED